MISKNMSFSRKIYSDKCVEVVLNIPPPSTVVGKNKNFINGRASLYLTMARELSSKLQDWKSGSFWITEQNLDDVGFVFQTAYRWLTDVEFADMYLETPTGMITINGKYTQLSAKTSMAAGVPQQIKVVPAIIEVANGKYEEGIYLFINLTSNLVILRGYQVRNLYRLFSTMDITKESILTLEFYRIAMACGNYTTFDMLNNPNQVNGFNLGGK